MKNARHCRVGLLDRWTPLFELASNNFRGSVVVGVFLWVYVGDAQDDGVLGVRILIYGF